MTSEFLIRSQCSACLTACGVYEKGKQMKAGRIGISALIAAVMISVLFIPSCVFAGNINSHEADLIAQASGTFEYEGKTYVVNDAALRELRSYLSDDGVDLTADQAASAAAKMYGNVEAGVRDGYLVPVGGESRDEDARENGSSTADNSKDRIITQKAGKATVEIDKGESQFVVSASGKDEVFKGQLPVKDAGFRLDTLFILLAAMICILPAAIIISYRLGLFAHNENGS